MTRAKPNAKSQRTQAKADYSQFDRINGSHPIKNAISNMYVPYDVFRRDEAEVRYFNFELAKEMGLLPEDHPHSLNKQLEKKLQQTFALQIVNEYDVLNNIKIDSDKLCKHQYMATRYLQMQHPVKNGMTSGDGRSMWNGFFHQRKGYWDISSCGTGATRLSPACAIEKKFFKTGDKFVSYGCGLADYTEGIIAAIFSDILHKNGVATERTLAVMRFKNGTAVNIRAAKNLLRPAHFFGFLRRNDYDSLKNLINYCIDRDQKNQLIPEAETDAEKYQLFLHSVANNFATAAAIYESEYIFCWMDWDGDNILLDGAILDYGTVRQFGLFHHEYRYSDVDKFSTSITEQKNKARLTVQTFAQAIDFLKTGEKKDIKHFKNDPSLDYFEEVFEEVFLKHLLWKTGYTKQQQDILFDHAESRAVLQKYRRQFRFFEKAVSRRKTYQTADGITRDAIFCLRDFLREFPKRYQSNQALLSEAEFIDLLASDYSSQLDRSTYKKKSTRIKNFQNLYLQLMDLCVKNCGIDEQQLMQQLIQRAGKINPYEKITGNAIIDIGARIAGLQSKLSFSEMQSLVYALVTANIHNPDFEEKYAGKFYRQTEKIIKLAKWARKMVKTHRTGI